jgi:hypothetical protein
MDDVLAWLETEGGGKGRGCGLLDLIESIVGDDDSEMAMPLPYGMRPCACFYWILGDWIYCLNFYLLKLCHSPPPVNQE